MKRTLVSLLSLLALSTLFTLSSCKKETTGNGTQFRATMEVCTSKDGKTALNGTALNWVEGDQIVVYGTEGNGFYRATPQTPATVAVFNNVSGTTGNAPFRAYYPSTLTTDGVNITLPAEQTYVEGSIYKFPMYAVSDNYQLGFKNLCSVLKLHLTKANTNITTIYVTANAEINGTYSVDNTSGLPVLAYVSGGTNTTTLTCTTTQAIDNGKDFYIYLPATFDSLKSIELNTDDGRYCIKTVKSNVRISVERNTVTEVSLGENDLEFVEPLPQGVLPGLFSVSATQQVRFSQGNLQYRASDNTWRFAEHQYDYVGNGDTHGNVYENGVKCHNSLISPTYTGWIDLFGFGTGSNPTLKSTNHNDYQTFVDWGVNAISNGGNQPNTWRTLSNSEWEYLLNTRANASAKKGTGSINGVHGLILLPDSWTLPDGATFIPLPSPLHSSNTYSLNTYTFSQWAAMEDAGAIFLPAAGNRGWTSIYNEGDQGHYWSSTPYNDNERYAYSVSFRGNSAYTTYSGRSSGYSVRLVRDDN
jgi:uncharacterized protein (TIGR02145 family)